jgi:integrase/recombinase XerD
VDKDRNIYQREGVYWLRISIGGREFRESLRTTSRTTARKERDKRVQELKRNVEGGRLIKPFIDAAVEFSQCIEEKHHFTWGDTTQTRYLCSMRAIARTMVAMSADNDFDIATFAMHEIDVATIADVVGRRKGEVAISTVNRDLTAFGAFMVYCRNKGWVSENPVDQYERQGMTEELPAINLPTETAVERILARGPHTFSCLIRFIRREGTRAKETAMIEWRDIEFDPNDADKATCTLRNTKGKLPRVIVLDPETVAMLREMPRSNGWPYVFFNDGDEGWYRDLSTRFWQYGQDVQFGARLHDLRHEFAIRKLKQGWSIYRVSAHLGHRSVVTTERYYFRYLTEEQKARARASGNNGFD